MQLRSQGLSSLPHSQRQWRQRRETLETRLLKIGHFWKYLAVKLFLCPSKLCISIVFVFSWDHCKSQEKLETMLTVVGGRNKRVLRYF